MNNSRSDSSGSTSIYETPITSPLNESVANSTRIDSSLFSSTSLTSPVFDQFDGRQSMDSIATDSTLRQTVRQLNSQACEQLQNIDGSIGESSLWLSQLGRRLSLRDQLLIDSSDPFVKLKVLVTEMDKDVLELIGIEQQMQSISLKCRSLREQIIAKSSAVHSLISEMSADRKQLSQKQTQTDSSDNNSKVTNSPENKHKSHSSGEEFDKDFRLSVKSEALSNGENRLSNNESNQIAELSQSSKNLFRSLPALVKGYLTRRLMKTEKVMQKIETIRETTQLLSSYHSLPPNKKITPEDINFHKRLIIQLENSCHEFYQIFMIWPKSAQMALIARSRQAILERHYRTGSALSNSSYLTTHINQSQVIELSSATKKAIQRKKNRLSGSQSQSNSKKVHRN